MSTPTSGDALRALGAERAELFRERYDAAWTDAAEALRRMLPFFTLTHMVDGDETTVGYFWTLAEAQGNWSSWQQETERLWHRHISETECWNITRVETVES